MEWGGVVWGGVVWGGVGWGEVGWVVCVWFVWCVWREGEGEGGGWVGGCVEGGDLSCQLTRCPFL